MIIINADNWTTKDDPKVYKEKMTQNMGTFRFINLLLQNNSLEQRLSNAEKLAKKGNSKDYKKKVAQTVGIS